MIKYSVIIPCYNHHDLCFNSIRSVKECPFFEDPEVIVVDSHSDSDHFFHLLEAVRESGLTNVRMVRSSLRLFPGGARNLGSIKASGRYLAFIDADCEIIACPDHSLRTELEHLLEDRLVIFGKTILVTPSKRFGRFFGRYFNHTWNDRNSANFFLISHSGFKASGGFKEDLAGGEDLFFLKDKDSFFTDDFAINHIKGLDFIDFFNLQFQYGTYAGVFFSRNRRTFSGNIQQASPFKASAKIACRFFSPLHPLVMAYKAVYYIGMLKGMFFR